MINYNFKLNTNMAFGVNSGQALASFLTDNKYQKVSVLIDSNVENSDQWQKVNTLLLEKCEVTTYFKNEVMEPSYDYLDSIRNEFDSDVDCLIAVGGGSTLDTAKAISVLVTNKKKAIEYRGFDLIENPGIPLVLMPTNAGSGSEVTPFAVFIDTEQKRKFGINTPVYLPKLTIIDPAFTLTCPKSVTIASGMDALTHTLESFVARKHTDISRFFSKEAFSLLYNNLPRVIADPGNIDLRSKVSLGAYYAGIALFNSAAGPAGVLSYPIGTLFKVTHGMAGSVFLKPVIEFNIKNGYKDYEELYSLIEPEYKSGSENKNKSELFMESFSVYVDNLEIPESLDTYGVSRGDINPIIEQVKWLWGAIEQNPVDMQDSDIKNILDRMITN